MLIAVDICNTLADINAELEVVFNKKRQRGVYRDFPDASEDWFSANTWIFGRAAAYRGAAKVLRKLASMHQLVYVTARPESSHDTTVSWLRENGFPNADRVIHAKDKAAVCKELGVSVAIDDSPEEISRLRESGIPVRVFAQDYNTSCGKGFRWK